KLFLFLSCNKQIIHYNIEIAEEKKEEIKEEAEKLKHAIGYSLSQGSKRALAALIELLETPNIIVEAPVNFAFSIQFNQYNLRAGAKEIRIHKAGANYYVKLHGKELSINAFKRNHNGELKEVQLNLSILPEENPFELVRGDLKIFGEKFAVSYDYYIPFFLIKEYLEATIGTTNPKEIISLAEKTNHFAKDMKKLFEQCGSLLTILRTDELLRSLNKSKGKFRVLINNVVAKMYKKGEFTRTSELEDFHINFGYNSSDKCFYAQIEKPNINKKGQTQNLTWTINEEGEVKTEVNMEKKFITEEMEAFEEALKEESNAIIPTLVNLLHLQSKEIHSHKKVFARQNQRG
ncbi:MAG: hypothetical protein NZ942_03255, partial [Candidatus Aenigmarchaeota archaeon]|nr:hypothetical protein [Candidatus Aenigmarchaeota archaeon]